MALIINGEVVRDSALGREVLRLSSGLEMDAPHAGGIDPAHLRNEALRRLVTRTLLLQTAAAQKLHVTPAEVDAERGRRWGSTGNTVCGTGVTEAIREDLLVERVRADLTRHVPRPSRAETEMFYRRNQHMYFLPAAVQAAHILRRVASPEEQGTAEAALQQAEEELRKGKPFDKVANRYSDCKGVGGAVGWVVRGSMVKEFEDVIFDLRPGSRSGIFQTVFGLHIATVTGRRAEGVAPFDEVRMEIANRMLADARQRTLAQVMARMEAESDIRYTEEASHD